MYSTLQYWIKLYETFKFSSLCLDIEVTEFGGPISILGLYQPKSGLIEHDVYIRGQNLTNENLANAFRGCKMFIVFNGLSFDMPKIRSEFPNAIPKDIPVFDIFLFAKKLGLDTNLKVLETTLGVERLHSYSEQRRIAVKLWKQYKKYNDTNALNKLIEYNKQDAVNLYPIAEELVARATRRIEQNKV